MGVRGDHDRNKAPGAEREGTPEARSRRRAEPHARRIRGPSRPEATRAITSIPSTPPRLRPRPEQGPRRRKRGDPRGKVASPRRAAREAYSRAFVGKKRRNEGRVPHLEFLNSPFLGLCSGGGRGGGGGAGAPPPTTSRRDWPYTLSVPLPPKKGGRRRHPAHLRAGVRPQRSVGDGHRRFCQLARRRRRGHRGRRAGIQGSGPTCGQEAWEKGVVPRRATVSSFRTAGTRRCGTWRSRTTR